MYINWQLLRKRYKTIICDPKNVNYLISLHLALLPTEPVNKLKYHLQTDNPLLPTEPVNTLEYHLQTDNPPLRLSYHCNCHYNSVRDPYEPSVGVGLGLPGHKPGVSTGAWGWA